MKPCRRYNPDQNVRLYNLELGLVHKMSCDRPLIFHFSQGTAIESITESQAVTWLDTVKISHLQIKSKTGTVGTVRCI